MGCLPLIALVRAAGDALAGYSRRRVSAQWAYLESKSLSISPTSVQPCYFDRQKLTLLADLCVRSSCFPWILLSLGWVTSITVVVLEKVYLRNNNKRLTKLMGARVEARWWCPRGCWTDLELIHFFSMMATTSDSIMIVRSKARPKSCR